MLVPSNLKYSKGGIQQSGMCFMINCLTDWSHKSLLQHVVLSRIHVSTGPQK